MSSLTPRALAVAADFVEAAASGVFMIDSLSPPTGEARTRWLRLLADARVLVGPHFLRAPAILGDEVCFPDPFRPTQLGATRLLRRMLAHASRTTDSTAVATFTTLQEQTSTPKTTDGETSTAWHGAASRLWFDDDDRVFLEIESSITGLPDVLLDELAVVVTRLWLHARGIDPENDVVVATAVALGFGPLLLQGTWVIEQGGETRGYFQTTWQRVSSSRRASPGELAFLIATWARARGVTKAKSFAEHLRDNQHSALKAAFAAPIDAGFTGPVVPTWPLMSGPIAVDDVVVPAPEDEPDHAPEEDADVEGLPVFRVIDRRIAGPLALCVFLTIPLGFAMAWLHNNVVEIDATVAVVVIFAWLGLGMVMGWRNIVDICSDPACRHDIEPLAQHCPGCGRLLGGRIASANDRLRAEEEWLAARHAPVPTTSAALFAVPRR